MLIVFVIAHLAGNLTMFGGPTVFNAYAATYDKFRPWFNYVEYGLLGVFLVHIFFTAWVVIENIKARGGLNRYAVDKPVGRRSLATRLMPYSGTYILFFVVWHIFDFTFSDKHGLRSYIGAQSFGLYGVVFNAFANPWHSGLYILAVCFLGLHLAHGVDSTVQTFGLNHPRYTPLLMRVSRYFALLMVIGYSAIPLYVLYLVR